MRALSTLALKSINAEETDQIWLPLVVMTNAAWTGPLRLVANSEDITSGGNLYTAFPFMVNLPDEEPEGTAVMSWSFDNTSLELMQLFRSVNGYISAQVFWVLAATPDTVEIGPFNLQLRGFNYDDSTVGGSLQVEPIMDLTFGQMNMNPVNAPALF